jgi:Ribbon-helix-helix protein, copG family
MAAALIHFDPEQKRLLTRRAKQRGKSFSQAVRDAVDLYLGVPVETEEELEMLAKAANQSAGRMIKRLDETIAHLNRTLKQYRKAHHELGR